MLSRWAIIYRIQYKPKELFPNIEHEDADSASQLVPEFKTGCKFFFPAFLVERIGEFEDLMHEKGQEI